MEIGSVWKNNSEPGKEKSSPTSSFWLKLFVFIFILMIVAGTTAVFFIVKKYLSSNQEIDFNIAADREVFIGAPFKLNFNFTNVSKNNLKDVTVTVFLPKNTLAIDGEKDKRFFVKNLGDLETGASLNGEINLIISGDAETLKDFPVTVAYSDKGVKFEKKQDIEVTAQKPAVDFDLKAPSEIVNNENFNVSVHYINVSNYNFPQIRIIISYPNNFSLTSSTPLLSNNSLKTDLPKNKDGEIDLSGSAIGPDQSSVEFKARAEYFFNGDWYPILEKSIQINFSSLPLSLKIKSDASSYVFPNNEINYELDYANAADIALNDVVVKAKLAGELFDFSTLKTNGAYNSLDNTITWNAANAPELKSIGAKTGGNLHFNIKLKPQYPIIAISDKNFSLKISAEISSLTVPYNVNISKTVAINSLETKVGGALEIIPQIYFKEPTFTDIINKGSLPPRVNQPIDFTIHWIIKNYANSASNVIVKSILANGIKFTGAVRSRNGTSSLPIFNDRTGEITWQIDNILANRGVVSLPLEAVFQVEVIPNIIDVNQPLKILQDTFISGTDDFTNVGLNNSSPAISTFNIGDRGFNSNNGIVTQ